jgi:AcrR family transcriptional regulator
MIGNNQTADPRATILSAAIEQIAQRGYDGVRLRDIARSAGVSIGLVQHYFGAREDLLAEAFEHHCAALLDGWSKLTGSEPDPWQRIIALVDRLAVSPDLSLRASIWAEFCSSAARRPELRPALRRVYTTWREFLRGAITEGVAAETLRPIMLADQIVDLLLVQIDGALLAIAGDVGYMDGARLHELVVGSAEVLLGRTDEA